MNTFEWSRFGNFVSMAGMKSGLCSDEFTNAIEEISEPQRLALVAMETGATFIEAARKAGVARVTLWRWCRDVRGYIELVGEARQIGEERRKYLQWLRHPFRGLRPPRPVGARSGPYPVPKWGLKRRG